MPSLPLRIAILECGTPLPNTVNKYGSYGGVFASLLRSGADALSYPNLSSSSGLSISTFDVINTQSYPSLQEIDAILLTASGYNAFDEDPWILKLVAFVKEVLEQRRVRIIGACFGHQIVGRALGARVGKSDKGWEVGVTRIELTKRGQEIFGQSTLALHQIHGDIVYDYPPGVEELAYTDACPVQSMYISKRVMTVQGHPEFTEEIMKELLDRAYATGFFDKKLFEDSMKKVDKYQDGVVVAQAFLRFLLEE
ncbi:class I glutamine amidotransferase-like protein [Stipitochalara longipes BDJ]|nr:class I glutamine amidotransferase-like protein [Stipitochalara longipes BDJ]